MENPTEYVSSDNVQQHNATRFIDEYSDDLKTMSGKCMDIGCGPGDITKNILLPALPASATIIGTDIGKNMIEYANRVYADKVRIVFDVLDIQTEYLPEKYISEFDHIFSFHAFHWCSNIRQAFENTYNMLRPGGTMLTLFIAEHDIFDIFKLLSLDHRYAPYIDRTSVHTLPLTNSTQPQKELSDLLESIGFKVQRCSHQDASYFDAGNFISSIKAFTSILNNMPHDKRDEFYTDFRHKYMKGKVICTQLCDGQKVTGTLHPYKQFVIYAKK